jgi:hypothetical protein
MGEGVSGLPPVCWDWPSLVQRCMRETSQASRFEPEQLRVPNETRNWKS